ncbi:hypothetical protein BSLG_002337 [Batrachochytrium salamandrivorans]|nr:hypothetical protein BSLG_002337 [Batrachochytrium salamandrivorans]
MSRREEIRKDSKSIYNRLRSIQHDANFVQYVVQRVPSLPVVPNERAGTWYTDPALWPHGISTYFKSTDGHHGQWDFNLRRLNYHFLDLVAKQGGCILVDATRKGKRFPDSLAKTVPLWCSVINYALALLRDKSTHTDVSEKEGLNHTVNQTRLLKVDLHCPSSVSLSEQARMRDLVEGFANKLLASCIDLTEIAGLLEKPLRPIWVTPVTRMFMGCDSGGQLWDDVHADLSFTPILCISASMDPLHMDMDDIPVLHLESNFSYIQGAADDSEMWAPGLTSSLFWAHLHSFHLSDTTPQQCEQDVRLILDQHQSGEYQGVVRPSNSAGAHFFDWIGDTGIAVGSFHAAEPPMCWDHFDVIINCGAREFTANNAYTDATKGRRYLYLDIPEGKKGQNKLFECIPKALKYIEGKDRSVGICLALLLEYTNVNPELTPNGHSIRGKLCKESIRDRLLFIQRFRKVASPSRATLKKVNLYFLGADIGIDDSLV